MNSTPHTRPHGLPDQGASPAVPTRKRARRDIVAQCRLDTPWGPMLAAATVRGLCGLWFDGQRHHPGPLAAPVDAAHPLLRAAAQALADFARDPASVQRPPLDPQGTPFQQAVWQTLLALPSGSVTRYGDIAASLGRPTAARAVGAAIGRNPISLLVPCHRVSGSDGRLTGYAGGLERKRALLAHEAR